MFIDGAVTNARAATAANHLVNKTYADNASNISTGTLDTARLDDSGVSASTYGSATSVPIITVDAKGRVTSATSPLLVVD